MKNNTETVSEIIFTYFPSSTAKSCTNSSCNSLMRLVARAVKQKFLTHRDQLQSSIAALGIGTILLISIYLFLSQLAEYGWQ